MLELEKTITLSQLTRQIGEQGKLSRLLRRISVQYGNNLAVTQESMVLIREICLNGCLDKKTLAQVFQKLTEFNGSPVTHMSGYEEDTLKRKTMVGRKKSHKITYL